MDISDSQAGTRNDTYKALRQLGQVALGVVNNIFQGYNGVLPESPVGKVVRVNEDIAKKCH
jgi:hypothetical protein